MTPERFGNYTLLRPLGRGGMAEVFLARAQSVGGFEKLVAIKRLLPPFNSDRQITSMLGDEARLSVWLNHPNIVQILDFGRVGKTYFIAMEFVEGCDLCDLIRPRGESPGRPLPLPTALYVMALVAEALAYAHRRCHPESGDKLQIVHRDVSPHNVLISTEGQVKLADFGLARASISVHQSFAGVIRGKFSYMPKEQAHGHDIDHRIDLFAAGVTLYEALTGAKPYTSTTLAQQLYQLEQPIPPPSAHVADIPEEIDDLTMEALCPEPEERYQTADDLAADLRSALLKLSTFGQEEKQLTALVKGAVAGTQQSHHHLQPLPRMSLADIPITDDNLIGEELLTLQKTNEPEQSSEAAAPTTDEIPDLAGEAGDEDEDADTKQFLKASEPLERSESFDAHRTSQRGRANGEGSPRAAAPKPAPAPVQVQASFTEMPPEIPDELTDEFSNEIANERPLDGSLSGSDSDLASDVPPDGTLAPVAGSLEFSSPDLPSPSPFDTLQDPEEAGQRARAALEEMRTLQRSPEEALAAFQRALDDRAPKSGRPTRPQLTWKHWVAVGGGAFVIFCLGLILGYSLKRPHPTAPVATRGDCPEPEPCPACPGPSTTPLPVKTTPLDASVEPRSHAAPDGAGQRVVSVRTHPDGKPKAVRRPPRPRPRPRPAGKRPSARSGYLAITADGKAKAYIDDRRFASPVPIRLPLRPGIHTVRVLFVETNHWSSTRWVTIKTGKTKSVFFSSLE